MIFGNPAVFAIHLRYHDYLVGTEAYKDFANLGMSIDGVYFGDLEDTLWLKHYLGFARDLTKKDFSIEKYRGYFDKYWNGKNVREIFIHLANSCYSYLYSSKDPIPMRRDEGPVAGGLNYSTLGDSYFMDHYVIMFFQTEDGYINVCGHVLDTEQYHVARVPLDEFRSIFQQSIDYLTAPSPPA